MSAAEIIEAIRKLPPSEQERVRAFLEAQRKTDSAVRYADDAEFEKSTQKVLHQHAELFRRLAK